MKNAALILTLLLIAMGATAQTGKKGQSKQEAKALPSSAIAWYGTLEEGMKVARKTGRPIFLMSAAPHRRTMPGMW